MKKLLSALLALSLALSICSVAASAAAGTIEDANLGSNTIDVQGVYNDGTTAAIVYNVDLSWGVMQFTYNRTGTNVWNPNTHTYTTSTTASWQATGNTITVTNHSNSGIKAEFAFANTDDYTTVGGAFSKSPITLPTAVDKAVDAAALTDTTTLTLTGTLPSTVTSMTKLGTITVTLSAN